MVVRVHNGAVTRADRRPDILARRLGSMLAKVREDVLGLSYDDAAELLCCDADLLARVETGFEVPGPDEVARILVAYGVREARAADMIIDMAHRAGSPPPWLAPHVPRLSSDDRDLILIEAQATLAQVHGCRLIPLLAQSEGYFRATAPGALSGCDPGEEWDLLSHRQAHQPAGVTRLLDVIIDESALDLQLKDPKAMAGQIRHLLTLDDSPHATVRVIPWGAPFREKRGCNFDVLSFAGTTDRIGVAYTIIGASLASGDVHDSWTHVANIAVDQEQSRAILENHLATLTN
jgi:Domain of unknown function (DUF5753)/Helix-turn-helix domain